MHRARLCLLALALGGCLTAHGAATAKLRILTWSDYVPAELAAEFQKETGIEVEVTLSNNEDIIARLRASNGAGFDLAQPSQDRIGGAQQRYHIYKPIDTRRVNLEQFLPDMLESVRKNTTQDGKLYALPYLWGAEGLVVNRKRAVVTDYLDLCKPELKGKTALRLRRPVLMAFAFAMGKDPFALYSDPKAYGEMIEEVGRKLIQCKANLAFTYNEKDEVLNGVRSGQLWAAMLWDSGAWTLNREVPAVRFVNPRAGALAWLDTFALPAQGQNDAGAYAWINFLMRPENAARVTRTVGNFTAARGALERVDPRLKTQFFRSFPEGFSKLRWYPAVPAGLEDIERRTLERVRAAP
ncbi:MAG: extracellular solute-binding protein [Pseudomonadota bacterium]